ncbi:40959_t:CDS:2, partial [Gigaspora margarita]
DLNIEIDDESDEQLDDEPLELFEGHVKKDENNHEISRLFLCHHARKPPTQKKSHNTEKSGSCHTDYPQTFENQFEHLLELYPKISQYLNRTFYPDRYSWARAYTYRHFTASAQATSQVESINSHIKAITCRSHTTLYNLFSALDSLIANQDYYYNFISWKSLNLNVKLPNICDTMYLNVDSILKIYVAPNLIKKIRNEINHSLFYHSTKISSESLNLYQMQDDDTIFVDNTFDYPLAHSFTLFKQN